MKEDTHKLARVTYTGKYLHTLWASCGHFKTFDMEHTKKYETGFVQNGNFSCDECRRVEGLELLRDL